jgi:solute carrier family 35 protein F5
LFTPRFFAPVVWQQHENGSLRWNTATIVVVTVIVRNPAHRKRGRPFVEVMFSKEYLLGLVFIVLVALIWALSSVVAQFLYYEGSFDSPFLLTYLGTSLFTLWLPIKFSTKLISSSSSSSSVPLSNSERNVLLTDASSYQNVADHVGDEGAINNNSSSSSSSNSQATAETLTTQEISPTLPHSSLLEGIWTHDDHVRVAVRIAPVWFIANWAYNASLLYTSITSSTVLASTSSLFTFLFAVLAKDETFSWIRLIGVCLGVSGGVLTALHDASDRSRRLATSAGQVHEDALALLGDFLGLVSAVGYGAYAVQTRIYCPKDERLYSMQLLLGYIGLINMTVLSPVAIYIMISTGDLRWLVIGFVFLKGLFDNFLRYVPA